MSKLLTFGIVVSLFNRASPGLAKIDKDINKLVDTARKFKEDFQGLGATMTGTGIALGGGVMKSVQAFSRLEDASERLQSTMMRKDGTVGAFDQVNALAIQLGNRLPGTTADFLNMMAALKQRGVGDNSILGGVGEATANLAVMLKQAPEQMAETVAKLKESSGTADRDMLAFMDTIQRLYNLGVDTTEMTYAFSRSAGSLAQFKIQGLEASNALAPLFAMLIKGGASGETVGTGFGSILNTLADPKKLGAANALMKRLGQQSLVFSDKQGNFLGVQNMMEQFDRLRQLSAGQQGAVLRALFGGGQDQQMVATLINEGMGGYARMVARMEEQASLNQRVNKVLGTLTNLWDAATGTFENALAGFAEAMKDDIKAVVEWFGRMSEALGTFFKEHPKLTRAVGLMTLGLAAFMVVGGAVLLMLTGMASAVMVASIAWPMLATALSYAAKAFGILRIVMLAVGRALLLNPIGLVITAIALGAALIYANWAPIKQFFLDLWASITAAFDSAWTSIMDKVEAIRGLWDSVFGAPSGGSLGSPSPSVGDNRSFVGGEIVLRVQDDRVKVGGLKSDNPDVPISVDTGAYMVAP